MFNIYVKSDIIYQELYYDKDRIQFNSQTKITKKELIVDTLQNNLALIKKPNINYNKK